MSQTYPLDGVIRRSEPALSQSDLDPEERLVIFDAKARRVLPKKPVLSWGKDLRFFVVSLHRHPVECQGPVLLVKSITTRSSFNLECSYEAYCERGNEEKLVAAVHRGEHPAAVVNQFLSDRFQDFVGKQRDVGRDVCLEFVQLRAEIESHLEGRACDELGITLDVFLRPQLEPKLGPVPIKTGFFPVRVRDHDKEFHVKVEAELAVDEAEKMRAFLAYHQVNALEETVRRCVRQFLQEEVTFHAFSYEFNGSIRERLVGVINAHLREHGRKVSFLRLESPVIQAAAAGLREIEHTVECGIRDCQDRVRVSHRLQMSLCDLGRFRSSGIEDLEKWTRSRLDEITRGALFEKKYVDLLLGFGPQESEIKARMEREAEGIGHAVRQLIVIPDLDPLTWKDGILLDKNDDSYATQDSRVEVGLNVVVHLKIERLDNEKITRYLTPQSRIRDDIQDAIRKQTRRIMHGIDPESFYMHFSHTDDPNGQPVKEVIESGVAQALVGQFGIDEIHVLAKPLETDLTKRLGALQQGPHMLQVTSLPLRSGGKREEVTYRMYFDVLGVHEKGWHTFRLKSFASPEEELERIKEILREDIRGVLDTVPSDYLQYSDVKIKQELERIFATTILKIVRTFGVVIAIVSLRREATRGEVAEHEVLAGDIEVNKRAALKAAESGAEARLDQLEMLERKEHELIEAGSESDDVELREVRRRIEESSVPTSWPTPQNRKSSTSSPPL